MLFWIVSTTLALVVAGLMALALLRARPEAEPPAAYDLRVYRDQLKEVDRDLARGVIDPADADRVRTEVSRRILAADAQLQAQTSGSRRRGPGLTALAAGLAAVLVAGAALLYGQLGAPGYDDLPRQLRIEQAEYVRQTRPEQAAAEDEIAAAPTVPGDPQYADLMEKLRATVRERPDDLQGQVLLAQNEAALGNFIAARVAQEEVIRIRGDAATSQDFADLGEMMVLAAGGYVSPEAEMALGRALQLDRRNPVARYYWGLMMVQIGRPDIAFSIWDQLLAESPAEAPWRDPIEARMPELASLAGERYEPRPPAPMLPPLPGPSREDVEAAGEMSPEAQLDMARGMVAGLEARLDEDGGAPEDWARLITSLAVLGEAERAEAARHRADTVFAEDDAALAVIAAAAAQAGLSP